MQKMTDPRIAVLQQLIASCEEKLAKRDQERVIALKKKQLLKHKQLAIVQHLQHELAKLTVQREERQRQERFKHARADHKEAQAAHAAAIVQAQAITDLEQVIARKQALMQAANGNNRQLEILNSPQMIDGPDWDGSKNWQPCQHVTQHVYKLDKAGKLARPARTTMRISLAEQHFAMGGFRYVYYAKSDLGARFVAKRLYAEGEDLQSNVRDVEADIQDHLSAQRCISEFHARAERAHAHVASMHFTCSVSLIIVRTSRSAPACGSVVYFLEPVIEGQYCKWIQNNGEIDAKPSITSPGVIDTTQAMVHYSYETSLLKGYKHRALITDIQGFQLPDGSITLIDPAICRSRVPGVKPVGADYGIKAATKAFFDAHTCSHICRSMKLKNRQA